MINPIPLRLALKLFQKFLYDAYDMLETISNFTKIPSNLSSDSVKDEVILFIL
ncbi:hypothetical protein HanXRQr2_Chr04g0179481 [Helianthus annuus]|uniref:Uncharacterized protein n=1 Tax=Helianthus annuus TaxID=4232 RepID=A0A9K3NS98_HELAN|nr:hypothetical protein HanXRQr2_Chr04g0179481 [Helianthus annuus]KAJ0932382.1 hypothetical protein HanPSC8_Chr04g0173021 [Helianthus annuus]